MKIVVSKIRSRIRSALIKIYPGVLLLLKNKYFYIGVTTLVIGTQLNYVSQTYLHYYTNDGKNLPLLSDLVLDNIPLWDISYIYDIFAIVSQVIFILYIIHKDEFHKVPYFLLLSGIFQIVRAVFIILTPLGNPPNFGGSDDIFNGFSKFELGVYPSGHIGIAFLYFLFANNKTYKNLLLLCVIIITAALFLSRAHYSIDVLSGIFFAYAIKAFGDKYCTIFILHKANKEEDKIHIIPENK